MVLDEATFEEIVSTSYESLYRFAFSLTEREADARDLTQEAFSQLARKAAQIHDKARVKSWLFTTLYRAFIDSRRRQARYPHVDVESASHELPVTSPVAANRLDAEAARQALMKVDEVYRTPLTLFYLGEHSYLEIAEILNVPPGTVMSRIARGRTRCAACWAKKARLCCWNAQSASRFMNYEEAKAVLQVYRSNGADASDLRFAEALKRLEQDPELARWFEEQKRFDASVAQGLRTIAVPGDLQAALLSSRPVVRLPLWQDWRVRAAVAASIAFLAIAAVARLAAKPKPFADFRQQLVEQAWAGPKHLDKESSD
jgi:RNA polymerase sigma-70 factor (ECF subfamily)